MLYQMFKAEHLNVLDNKTIWMSSALERMYKKQRCAF